MGQDSWNVYLRRLNLNGTSQKDRYIKKLQRTITDKFTNNPSYESISINDVIQDVHIINNSKNPYKKQILCIPDESISVGDLILWDEEYWLCTEALDNKVQFEGIIEKCDNELKYLNASGTIVTVPCIVRDRILMDREENNYYLLPDNKIWVDVGSSSDSTPISVDDRFILGSQAYKIDVIDDATRSGIITFKMSFDGLNKEDDSVTLGIANYYSKSHVRSITILNGASVDITLGNSLQIEYECLDNNLVVTSPTVTFSLLTGSTGVLTITSGGLISSVALGSGSVKAKYDTVTDTINIDIVTSAIVNYTYGLLGNYQPDNEVKYNQTKIFTAYKYYATGTIVTGANFEFTVILGTGASTDNYILTTSSNNTCTIKTLEYPYSITLIAQDLAIPANTTSKVISLKGLI